MGFSGSSHQFQVSGPQSPSCPGKSGLPFTWFTTLRSPGPAWPWTWTLPSRAEHTAPLSHTTAQGERPQGLITGLPSGLLNPFPL